jgi:hypothetical protein
MDTRGFFVIIIVAVFAFQLLLACDSKNPFPLSEPGNYQFGTRVNYTFIDASRNNREVKLYA